jgi:hypothetical protein
MRQLLSAPGITRSQLESGFWSRTGGSSVRWEEVKRRRREIDPGAGDPERLGAAEAAIELETLRAYAAALGGEVDITVRVGPHTVKVA